MDNRLQNSSASGIALDDIYFVLFRHKWKIILLFIAGVAGAWAIPRLKPPEYQSEARLMIKYVVDNPTPGPVENEGHMQSTDPQGQSIINNEVLILTSLDVCKKVAEDIGPEKIMARLGGSHDIEQAAGFINSRLKVDQESRSSVISVDFKHPDPEMVVPILSQIIAEYKTAHRKDHQPEGAYDFYTKMKDDCQNELEQIEKELKEKRDSLGVVSTEAEMDRLQKEMDKTSQSILDARATLALSAATLTAMTSFTSGRAPVVDSVTNIASTNAPSKPEPQIAPEVTDAYAEVLKRITAFRAKEDEYVSQNYLPESTPMTDLRAEIKKAQQEKVALEAQNPGLKLAVNPIIPVMPGQPARPTEAPVALSNQAIQVAALQQQIEFLEKTMTDLHGRMDKIAQIQPRIRELESKEKQKEEELQTYSKGLATARTEDAAGANKAPNIIVIQQPTPPGRNWAKRYKAMEMLVVAGLGGGIAWAFLIEFFLDTSIKRAKEVKTKLGMPLFLSIPANKKVGQRRPALTNGRLLLKNGSDETSTGATNGSAETNGKLEIAPWDPGHALRPYYEALRDRLLGYFEARNLTHNPKLVAVTGSSKGSGATTLAMGLAASLSETGDGNVLLVDMNQEHGASQHFHKGKPDCGLDEVLENGNRETALVQENLYVVNGNSNNNQLPRILPKRFASLVPKFKASDFDYIIFDMPPISQTSITLRLAGFMDTVLLVVESEKTKRETISQAGALLAEAKANVNIVLNKTRSYVPGQLQHEV